MDERASSKSLLQEAMTLIFHELFMKTHCRVIERRIITDKLFLQHNRSVWITYQNKGAPVLRLRVFFHSL